MSIKTIIAISIWLLPFFAIATDFPAPPRSTITNVSNAAKSMGMTLSIRKFTTKMSIEDIVTFYQKRWRDQGVQSQLSPWLMLGTRIGDKFYNVQMQRKGRGTWGYLSVSNLPKQLASGNYQVTTPNAFPTMTNSQILDHQQHKDLLNIAKTSVITNRFSVQANAQFYIRHFDSRGWQAIQDTHQTLPQTRLLEFAKGRESLTLTLKREKKLTYIVANMTKKRRLGE